ncbi:MAG TPA: element excision factor XisH family protein, partial [Kofleriaceae bacterium]|nr:element excision factor XisH family protein [Kofleriaceae bacterium]
RAGRLRRGRHWHGPLMAHRAPALGPARVLDGTHGTLVVGERSLPKRDMYRAAVKQALIKDGWTITHDPLTLSFGVHNLYVDLGAERVLAAERDGEQIAVEIRSFVGHSEVADMEQALGQYLLSRSLLQRQEPGRRLVLAVPVDAFETILRTELGRAVREDYALSMLVFEADQEVIRQWLP